jgi:hypothetical protein
MTTLTVPPASAVEFTARFEANYQLTGTGAGTTVHAPCPFCAAPDFALWPLTTGLHDAMTREATCRDCGRSGAWMYGVSPIGDIYSGEFVQTGGDDPPAWLLPPPRRLHTPGR